VANAPKLLKGLNAETIAMAEGYWSEAGGPFYDYIRSDLLDITERDYVASHIAMQSKLTPDEPFECMKANARAAARFGLPLLQALLDRAIKDADA